MRNAVRRPHSTPGRKPNSSRRLLAALVAAMALAAAIPSAASAAATVYLGQPGEQAPGSPGGVTIYEELGLQGGTYNLFIDRPAFSECAFFAPCLRANDPSPQLKPGSGCEGPSGFTTNLWCPVSYPAGSGELTGRPIDQFTFNLSTSNGGRFAIDPISAFTSGNAKQGLVLGGARGSNDIQIGAGEHEPGCPENSSFPQCSTFAVEAGTGTARTRINIGDVGGGNVAIGGGRFSNIFTSANGRRDFVTCNRAGSFGDYHVQIDLQDVLLDQQDCAEIRRAPKDQHPTVEIKLGKVSVRGGRAPVRLSCPADSTVDCRGKLRLLRGKRGRQALGAHRYRIRKGHSATVLVGVGGARGPVRAIATERGSDGQPRSATARLRLR